VLSVPLPLLTPAVIKIELASMNRHCNYAFIVLTRMAVLILPFLGMPVNEQLGSVFARRPNEGGRFTFAKRTLVTFL
jgi:hypothetical protein